jgi:hypothetical protein
MTEEGDMAPNAIDNKIAAKIAAQQKLTEEIAGLRREQSKKARAERQKAERRIGRLAVKCGLHVFTQEQLQPVFQRAEKELREKGQTVRHLHDRSDSDEEQGIVPSASTS